MPKDPSLERISWDLSVKGVQEMLLVARRNFESLGRYFDSNGQLNGFKHVEFNVQAGESQLKIKHGLGFVPKDFILTRLLAPSGAKLTLHHKLFDQDNIVVSGTGWSSTVPMRVRALVGTFQGREASSESLDETAITQEIKAIL